MPGSAFYNTSAHLRMAVQLGPGRTGTGVE